MTNADILKKKLRADVAAAKSGLSECTCTLGAPMTLCQGCKAALERSDARARLAAFGAPALLEALVDIVYTDGFPHHVPNCGNCKGCRGMLAIADCAKALEVSDA